MNKFFLKLAHWRGGATDPLHFGWFTVESFVLNFAGKGSISSSPQLRPSDLPNLPLRSAWIKLKVASAKDGGVKTVSSPQELSGYLWQLKRDNKLPVVIATDSDFFHWIAMEESYNFPGGGIVKITDYDPATGTVTIENQWNTAGPRVGRLRR